VPMNSAMYAAGGRCSKFAAAADRSTKDLR
jgi:hypothetical protein